MKSKAKPAKGSARTKRFDVGGTVGALAGLGTLAYLMSRKKKGEAQGTSSDTGVEAGIKAGQDQNRLNEGRGKGFEPSPEYEEAVAKDRMNKAVETHRQITSGGSNEPEPAPAPAPKPKPVVKKVVKKGGDKKAGASTDQGAITTTGVDAGIAAGNRKSEPDKTLAGQGGYQPPTEQHAAEVNKIFKDVKDPNKGKYAGKGKRAVSKAGKIIPGAYKDSSGVLYDVEGNPVRQATSKGRDARPGKKAGGMVKKYASGGSVSSASKRADGIAMRGKTRGKIC